MDEKLNNLSAGLSEMEDKIYKFAKSTFPYLVMVLSLVFSVLRSLFTFGFINPFSREFWVTMFTNLATTIMTYAAFTIHGNDEYKMTNEVYKANLAAWKTYSAKVRALCPNEFICYCRDYARDCVKRKRRASLEAYSLITWETFEEKYLNASRKSILDDYKRGKIDKSDLKGILLARRPMKTPCISATAILCGADTVAVEKLAASKRNYILEAIAVRPFSVIVFSCGISILAPVFLGANAIQIIFSAVTTAFLLCMAAFSGIRAGNSGARRENSDMKSKILFLDAFMQTKKATP